MEPDYQWLQIILYHIINLAAVFMCVWVTAICAMIGKLLYIALFLIHKNFKSISLTVEEFCPAKSALVGIAVTQLKSYEEIV